MAQGKTLDQWLRAVEPDEGAPELSRWLRQSFAELSTVHPPEGPRPAPALPERYEDRGQLGIGGMGEVRRVYDRLLSREIALKALHVHLARQSRLVARFHQEASVTAGLVHPAIVPVHDLGVLPDGRPFFTMRVVEGEPLTAVIREVHAASISDSWRETDRGWNLPRLIDALVVAGEALAFAHGRSLYHRDFKPDNVLVGAHGEVLVVDWGLVRLELGGGEGPGRAHVTMNEEIEGTPAYMAPEQAAGRGSGRAADAWALVGALYHALTGRPPWRGDSTAAVLGQARSGVLPELSSDGPPIPEELAAVVRAGLVGDPEARPAVATIVAALRRWRDGEGRRTQARSIVERARALERALEEACAPADQARRDADAALLAIPPWAGVAAKAAAWAADDAARAGADAIQRGEREVDELLAAALALDPDCAEAHTRACERLRAAHQVAERAGEPGAAAALEPRIRRHAQALPERHATRRALDRYLEGRGALTVVTEVSEAEIAVAPWISFERRLVPGEPVLVARGALHAADLPVGRWLVEVRAAGRVTVRYPVAILRERHWDGVAPGGSAPFPLYLPRHDELGREDCYVPAGWCVVGGDSVAPASLPRTEVWVQGFVMRRFPVRNREYVAFLDDLVLNGQTDRADACVPRERSAGPGIRGPRIYGRDEAGRHGLVPDADGDIWQADWPVTMVDHAAAWTYARWVAGRTGQPWRLPGELEWEKAARGGDGRWMPWGDFGDPSWYCGSRSFPGRALIEAVEARPVDESPYGVRCLAGHVVEWTADRMHPQGPRIAGGVAVVPDGDDDGEDAWNSHSAAHRIVGRGGSWATDARFARAAFRTSLEPWTISSNVGIRIARPIGPRM